MVPCKQRAQNWDIRTRNSHYPELYGQFVQPSAWECVTAHSQHTKVNQVKTVRQEDS